MLNLGFENFQNAIADNRIEELKHLLEAGCDPNARFESGLTPIHLAVWYNRPQLIKLLISYGAQVDQLENLTKKTPLHIAAYFGYLDCCKALIEKKASVNQRDIAFFIPLHYAALQGHLEIVQLLSDNTKDLLKRSICGTPIDVAIRHQNIDIIEYFLVTLENYFSSLFSNSDIFSCWKRLLLPIMGETLLYFATIIEAKDIVRLLLAKKRFCITSEMQEPSPLHIAAEKGYNEIVKLLLDDLGYFKEADIYFASPLELAIKNNHQSIIDLFVERGEHPWLVDKVQLFGDRPASIISAAVWDGDFQKLKEILAREGGYILFEKDKEYGDPPLQTAMVYRQIEIAKLFIEYGGKELILQTDEIGMTALHRAAFHGILELYQLILEIVGVEFLKQPCETFGTPLDCALSENHIEIVEWTLGQFKPDLSFEELFLNERDHWVLMDLNPKIGGFFTKM